MENKIEVFTATDGTTQIDVQFEGDTVWLNQGQIVQLFQSSKANINEHINTIFKTKELLKTSTVRKFRTVRQEGNRKVSREVEFFNLEVIISVGYRVNSIRGIQFRQWATQRLKDYLIAGYAINQKRVEEQNKKLEVPRDGIRIMSRAIEEKATHSEDFIWLQQYSLGLQLLDDYDHENLDKKGISTQHSVYPNSSEYENLIQSMRKNNDSEIFGKVKDGGFYSAIHQIKKGFDQQDLYPSIQEKAAMLLYLIIKNHAFVDGNKRIAAACFLLFLNKNKLLYNPKGHLSLAMKH